MMRPTSLPRLRARMRLGRCQTVTGQNKLSVSWVRMVGCAANFAVRSVFVARHQTWSPIGKIATVGRNLKRGWLIRSQSRRLQRSFKAALRAAFKNYDADGFLLIVASLAATQTGSQHARRVLLQRWRLKKPSITFSNVLAVRDDRQCMTDLPLSTTTFVCGKLLSRSSLRFGQAPWRGSKARTRRS